VLFVLEHLEPELSEWLYIEYSHAAKIVGKSRLLITNMKKEKDLNKLSKIARVERSHVFDIFSPEDLILLDPSAPKSLSPRDFDGKSGVVVGGILGDDPPQGRTKKLFGKSMHGARVRNLGPHQFSIDGAIYMAKRVFEGTPLNAIPVKVGVEIELHRGHSVELPYAYPVINRLPLISARLMWYLKKPWKMR